MHLLNICCCFLYLTKCLRTEVSVTVHIIIIIIAVSSVVLLWIMNPACFQHRSLQILSKHFVWTIFHSRACVMKCTATAAAAVLWLLLIRFSFTCSSKRSLSSGSCVTVTVCNFTVITHIHTLQQQCLEQHFK